MILRLIVNALLPFVLYVVLHVAGCSDLSALATGAGAPLAWGLAVAVRRHRVDALSLAAVAGFGLALVFSLATGGGALPLLLRHAVVTGAGGIACLVSVVIGRPLLVYLRPLIARFALGKLPVRQRPRRPRQYFFVLTTLLGVVLLAHAAANVVLALTLSTDEYLVVSHPVGWAITAAGALVAVGYTRRARSHAPA